VAASEEIRSFVWSLEGYERDRWDDCVKLMNLFLDNLSTNVGSFCTFPLVERRKECSVDADHDIYTMSRIPNFSYTLNFDKLLYRKAVTACQRCVEAKKIDSNGVPGRLLCTNIVNRTTVLPTFIFICNGRDFVGNEEGDEEDAPALLYIEEAVYALHGRVYSTSRSGSHFYSIGRVNTESGQFLAEFDNLADSNIRKIAEKEKDIERRLSEKLFTVYLCYKKI